MNAQFALHGIRNTVTKRVTLIAVAWTLGLLLGCMYLIRIPNLSTMRSMVLCRMSIMDLLLSLLTPFLVSYILFRIFSFHYILPFVFLKAFFFLCCNGAMTLAYGNAGWLVSRLLFFSEVVVTLLLLICWFDMALGVKHGPWYNVFVYLIPSISVGCFDYYILSPYVAMLLNY